MPIKIYCAHCGKVAEKKPHQIRDSKINCCSMDCLHKYQNKRVDVQCDWCGEMVSKSRSALLNYKIHFCNKSCAASYQTKYNPRTGDKTSGWKGGITAEKYPYQVKYRIDNNEKYLVHTKVSAAVQRGDIEKMPCEICNSQDNIDAHHDDYTKPFNIRWLCRKHHMEIHSEVKTNAIKINKMALP